MSVEESETTVDTHTLRAELKSWENAFKEKNGRKPGRADIKHDATIAAKYKLYDRIARREETAPKQTPRKSKRPAEPKEEKPKHAVTATPRKTPSKTKQESLILPALSPAPEGDATPAYIKCALGPTPLKDGRVLGIFDVLSATPAHEKDAQRTGTETLIAGTPSKSAPASSEHAFSKTPQSESKRNLFHAFAGTPLKRKREDEDVGTTSSKKGAFATPAFLRRSFPLASIDEESTETTASRPPFRKRNLVRSLSSMIQNLKKQEDERMDEEWDILNEIEDEAQGGGEAKEKETSKVMVKDSQAAEMPLGPDQAPVSDEDDGGNEETGRKPWKKKGLKRQTRRTNMKPVLHKAKKADGLEPWDQDSEEEAVPETQQQEGEAGDESSDSDSDAPEKKSAKSNKKKSTAKEKDDEKTSKAKPRKVNPDAHANYRALKIKNKNSKANGRGRRFGRR